MPKKLLCVIRPDLLKQGLRVPLADCTITLSGNTKREYRWLKNYYKKLVSEEFQIKYKNKWYSAYSIDFEFIN